MATITAPDFSSSKATGWEKFSNDPISFPESIHNKAPASRSAPSANTGAEHLSGVQFGGNKALSGLYANLTNAGYTAHSAGGPSGSIPKGMAAQDVYRNRLKQHMMSSASGNHSLGAALSATGGSMWATDMGSSKSTKTKREGGIFQKITGRGKGRNKNQSAVKSPHEGKNAMHLRNFTGSA